MKYIVTSAIAFLFIACSSDKLVPIEKKPLVIKKQKTIEEKTTSQKQVIQDLINFSQNIEYYTSYIKDDSYNIANDYESTYFSMWNIDKPKETLENIKWPFKYFHVKTSYGENLLPIEQSFFDLMHEASNFDNYLTLNKKAVILRYTNIRALPTSKPLLKDPSLAGEGFPFDYLQNSSINANAPVYLSHYSKDKQWAFIFSSFTYGWIKSQDVVTISDKYAKLWKNAKQVIITKEGTSLFTQEGEALFDTRIGMLFALVDEDKNNYTALSVSKYKNNEAMFHKILISKDIATLKPLSLNEKNINTIINEVSKTNYGWGGVYEQRDCSSTLMDLFTPFGLALPRNSSKQAKIGEIIDLSSLKNEEKIKMIKEKAIPFETLLYKHGHIVLYVGIAKDNVIVFHNTWGIKTKDKKKEGRYIIGKSIFSTLKIGNKLKNYDEDAELLRNIKSMNIITR